MYDTNHSQIIQNNTVTLWNKICVYFYVSIYIVFVNAKFFTTYFVEITTVSDKMDCIVVMNVSHSYTRP